MCAPGRDAVLSHNRTLDDAADVLETNTAQLGTNNERLRAQTKAMSSSTCFVWLLLLIVCMLFGAVVLVMKTVPKPRRH